MLVRIVGLGPGDPAYLTVGSINELRASRRAVALLAPPDLQKALEDAGIEIVRNLVADASLLVRGSTEAVEHFVERLHALGGDTIAIGVLGNPLSDFPGLPSLLRALEVINALISSGDNHRGRDVPGHEHCRDSGR